MGEREIESLPLMRKAGEVSSRIYLVDASGRVVQSNDPNQTLHVADARDVGDDLHDAIHAECRLQDCYLRHFCERSRSAIADGRHVECDAFDPVLQRFLNIRGQPIELRRKESRRLVRLALVTFEDITDACITVERTLRLNRELGQQVVRELERSKREERLRQRMQKLIECTANFIAMVDVDGRVNYVNPAGRKMLGIPLHEDLSGSRIGEFHSEDQASSLEQLIFPTATSAGTWTGRSVLRRRDGTLLTTSHVVIAHHDADGRQEGYSLVAHDMTQWLKGERELRELHEEQKRLSAELIRVQETERHRIAAEIHDSIGQSLSLIKLQVSAAEAQLKSGANTDALATLNSLLPRVQDAIGEVRRVTTDLHPSTLEDLGILPTLCWFLRELESAYPGIRIEKQFSVMEHEVPRSLRIVIFRILQEAVNNIVKHAAPRSVSVKLGRSFDRLCFDVEDDGCGFDPKTIMGIDYSGRGFGLSSMKERARFSGGDYVLRSLVGQGTSIHVEWPLRRQDQEQQ